MLCTVNFYGGVFRNLLRADFWMLLKKRLFISGGMFHFWRECSRCSVREQSVRILVFITFFRKLAFRIASPGCSFSHEVALRSKSKPYRLPNEVEHQAVFLEDKGFILNSYRNGYLRRLAHPSYWLKTRQKMLSQCWPATLTKVDYMRK